MKTHVKLPSLIASVMLLWFSCSVGFASAPVRVYGPPEIGTEHILNGNSASTPLDRTQPARYQQVYSPAVFEAFGLHDGGWIEAVDFRIDPVVDRPVFRTLPSIQINMSTTKRGVDGLSQNFDENIGADDTITLARRSVEIHAGGGFDFVLRFSQPFFYDPSAGNLLLDIRVYEGFGGVPPFLDNLVAILDAFDTFGDSTSSVYGFGNTMPSSGQPSTLGLATAFSVAPVPEPSSIALLVIGLGTVVTLSIARRTKG